MTMHEHGTGLFTAKFFTDYYAAMVLDRDNKELFVYAFDEGEQSTDYLHSREIDQTKNYVLIENVTLEEIKEMVYFNFHLPEFFQIALLLMDGMTPDDIFYGALSELIMLANEEPKAANEFFLQLFGVDFGLEKQFHIFGEVDINRQKKSLQRMFESLGSQGGNENSKLIAVGKQSLE